MNKRIEIRATDEQYAEIDRRAHALGLSIGTYLRMRALEPEARLQAVRSVAVEWGGEIALTETGDTCGNKWKSDNLPKADAVAVRKGPLTVAPVGSLLKVTK